ncbi:MAG: hypothetical protein KDC18_15980 [Alphaproteobacteria bacterium]|nr:hypothetical protein [Alphaproteobacteria bacterium]MCB9929630.1 hypothetical protein [Alphaproteobacteria bacterium]
MRDFGIGAALGLFLGLLIGLSTSEVVAGVVTALVALLGTLLGLRTEAAAGPLSGANGGRVAGFALVGGLAVLVALAARTHGWLEPSPAEIRDRWVAAGFSAADAAALAAFQRLGLIPAGRQTGEAKAGKAGTGALYADAGEDDACDALLARHYATGAALAGAMQAEGGVWARLAETVAARADDAVRLATLQAAVGALCRKP